MSGKYVFPANEYVESVQLQPAVLVEQNVIVWEENGDCEETVDFVDTNDSSTENIDESYVTAYGNNTTQYFSLNGTDETILNDIDNVSLGNNTKINGTLCSNQDNNDSIDVSGHQVVLFKIDNSDDLYGVQVAQDEEGNLQKYQFKVRQNEEGNLEAVPESIQILPLDNDCNEVIEDDVEEENEDILHSEEVVETVEGASVFVKQEHVSEHFDEGEERQFEEDEEEENIYQEPVDSKEGILEVSTSSVIHKQETFDPEESISETEIYGAEGEQYFEQAPEEINENLNDSASHFLNESLQEEEAPVHESSEHYEQLFVKESHLIEEEVIHEESMTEQMNEEPTTTINSEQETQHQNQNSELVQENDSDNDYEIPEGSHITGETTDSHLEELQINNEMTAFEASFDKQSPRTRKLIKNVIRKIKVKKHNDSNKVANTYLLIKHPEKENVGTATANITPRPNPRSILKCSVTSVESKKNIEDEKYEKRFAKSKEAQQARLFHNYIAQTKIIQAPVRQQRLPRKQLIKPMERTDEEIVVQEVVVCSNGFVETSEEGVVVERKCLKPTEYIQLSDSDEDYDPKSQHKRKKRQRKRKAQVEIIISDSEDDWTDDVSVVEIDESENEEEERKSKRPRGRPPKNSNENLHKQETSTKRPRGRPPKNSRASTEEEMIIVKTNNKCPKCPKSFPSEGSLRTHMQYHNFKDSNLNEGVAKINKYECDICAEKFKNNFLLTRHKNSHGSKEVMTCTICKKIFSNLIQLSAHKRMHVKQQMYEATTMAKVSPKKFQQYIKATLRKSEFKCKDCDKILPNAITLTAHEKLHKKYSCNSCGKKFLSSLMLQSHMQKSCVKKKSPEKRLSFPIRRSLNKKSRQTITSVKVPVKPMAAYNIVTNIKCDSCPLTFVTYTSLYNHKVIKHGLDKSDKSNNTAAKFHIPKSVHSGIPSAEKLKRIFKDRRRKDEK